MIAGLLAELEGSINVFVIGIFFLFLHVGMLDLPLQKLLQLVLWDLPALGQRLPPHRGLP